MKKKRKHKKDSQSMDGYLCRQAEQVAALAKKKHPDAVVQIKTYPEENVVLDDEYIRPDHYEYIDKCPLCGGKLVFGENDPLLQRAMCANALVGKCEAIYVDTVVPVYEEETEDSVTPSSQVPHTG